MNGILKIKKEEEEKKKNEIGEKKKEVSGEKKRGRKPKNYKEEYKINREQTKFFVDLAKENENLNMIFKHLEVANNKTHGREILFKDLAIYAIEKLTQKDIEKIQELSLSEMEKVERALDDHNKKSGTKLSLGEFLVKKLSIN